ncbi:MAG: DsrE family protein [Nitrososphaerota archaeon]
MTSLLIHCTHGREDPERATLAFIVGNVAASADQDVVVLLTIDGVWLATQGYADEIHKDGFPPLNDVMQSFRSNGGQIWACGTCAKPRNIGEDQLIEGAKIVTAANVVERMVSGATTLDF